MFVYRYLHLLADFLFSPHIDFSAHSIWYSGTSIASSNHLRQIKMGNTSSHQPITSSTPISHSSPSSSSSSSSSSSNSSAKSPKHFHIHTLHFTHHHHSNNRQPSSIDKHGALLKEDKDNVVEEDDDGTYLLRRGSTESREEWLARKQIMSSRIRGEGDSDVGVMVWKNYGIDGGKGQF